jgi:uncharacterized protein Yka (UPF0111/DUF47 family)
MKHEVLGNIQRHMRTPGFRASLVELAENGDEPCRSFADWLLRIAEKYGL